MKFSKLIFVFLFCWLASSVQSAFCQQPNDTIKQVEILSASKLQMLRPNDSTELQILSGKVRLKQENTLFDCDSCVINNRIHLFQAFGHVHINDADTSNAWSDNLQYLIDKRIAYLTGNVKLTDGKATLT